MKTHRFSAICLTGSLVALVVAIVLILLGGPPTHASPGVLYVAPGANCGGMTPCYSTVQTALDVALPSDEIRVAAGTYLGVNYRGGLAQAVYISKSVTIQGGYTTAFTEPPDPVRNLTTLDAQGLGRVIVISGTATSTIEGLRITGGDASGFGGAHGHDAGGGVYVLGAAATISDCMVYGNTASTVEWGYGGGVYGQSSVITLTGNTIINNIASTASGFEVRGAGGGVCLVFGHATLSGNTVQGNTAGAADDGYGGGMALGGGDFTLSGNTVQGNTASMGGEGVGGGITVEEGDVTLEGNDVQLNTASAITMGLGGGVALGGSNATLSGNAILGNTATFSLVAAGRGGGLAVEDGTYFTLTNNLVADNLAYAEGSGLWIDNNAGSPGGGRLLHTTIAHNLGSGQEVFVGDHTTVAFTNTIIAGHDSVGITVTTGSTATLEATLWYNSGPDTGGGGTVISSTNVTGDPAFANPSAWDYHLTSASAAIDQGVDAGVTTDIDGNSRPQGAGYDIGAYEYVLRVYLPLVLRQ